MTHATLEEATKAAGLAVGSALASLHGRLIAAGVNADEAAAATAAITYELQKAVDQEPPKPNRAARRARAKAERKH